MVYLLRFLLACALGLGALPLPAETPADEKNTTLPPAVELPDSIEDSAEMVEFERLLEQEGGSREHFFAEFINMIVMLCVVLGVMVVLAWLAKRFLHVRMQQVNTQSAIRVEERRNLGPKSTLYLIEVEGNRVLIGETPAGLVRLGQLDDLQEQHARAASSKFTRIMEAPAKDPQKPN